MRKPYELELQKKRCTRSTSSNSSLRNEIGQKKEWLGHLSRIQYCSALVLSYFDIFFGKGFLTSDWLKFETLPENTVLYLMWIQDRYANDKPLISKMSRYVTHNDKFGVKLAKQP